MSADAGLLPGNATAWERANSTVSERMLTVPVLAILKERDPAQCDAQFIAPLAWERSVHFWNPNDVAGNRARVASSFSDHLQYGSPSALEAEIALDTGLSIRVREFWELPGLAWPDFVIDVNINPGDAVPNVAAVYASVLQRKPPRDVLVNLRVVADQPPAPLVVGIGVGVTARIVVLPSGGAPASPAFVAGAAIRVMPYVKVLPFKG